MSETFWLIQGWDNGTLLYEKIVESNLMTISQVQILLKALTAKAALDYDEIVGSYIRRESKTAVDHLVVHQERPHAIFRCGSNPHFTIALATMGSKGPLIIRNRL